MPAKVERRNIRVMSFGGGVQSNAVMVLQARGDVHYDLFVFANVGEDSENPDTLAYIRDYTIPYCAKYNIPFVEVRKQYKGQPDSLVQNLYRSERSVDIPARMSNGATGNRHCTDHFKIEQIHRHCHRLKYTHATLGLGISMDEFWRMRDQQWHLEVTAKERKALEAQYPAGIPIHDLSIKPNALRTLREYPLIDLRLNRQDCKRIIQEAGLPEPPKSSCFFCPFKKRTDWQELYRLRPDLFKKAVEIEQEINRKRGTLGKDRLYLHRDLVPLDQAVGNQLLLFDMDTMDTCDSGVCMV